MSNLILCSSLTGDAASERLADAEATAYSDQRRAQKSSHAYHSSIYPPGSEFAICLAESLLMGAVVGVLNESLTESIKGFYKLRRAYVILNGIIDAEDSFMRDRTRRNSGGARGTYFEAAGAMPGGFSEESAESVVAHGPDTIVHPPATLTNGVRHMQEPDDDEEDAFFDAEEVPAMSALSLQQHDMSTSHGGGTSDPDPDSDIFVNPIDSFIHSGACLCFGLLLVMLSMIPPAFGKLLFIIGFKGDREKGLKLLWQASHFHNVHGGMAGLMLLGYYNNVRTFSDILLDDDDGKAGGFPIQRCAELLKQMRERYPGSRMWLLEDARMQANDRNLERAADLLDQGSKSQLKQVEGLTMFEKSMTSMYLHRYEIVTENFVKVRIHCPNALVMQRLTPQQCVSMNNWSHALYYYIAGSAQVELYRKMKALDPTKAVRITLSDPANTADFA